MNRSRHALGMSLLALLGATLEEVQAQPASSRIETALGSRTTLNSVRDPRTELGQWQSSTATKSKAAMVHPIQSNGLSALESLKAQANTFSNSLQLKNGVNEGRFDAPGLLEFSNFVSQTSRSSHATPTKRDEVEKLRGATIASIEKILKHPSSAGQRVELMLRLAELHAERHNAFLQAEMENYEIAYEKWKKNHRSGVEPKINQVQSLQAINAATQVLRTLVNQFPNHARTPDALYQLGFLLTEMRSDSATLYFQRLIERFPRSRFIPDAHLALGEFHFSRNKFSDALAHYQKALQDRKNRSYPYAVYKLGWTFYNLRSTEEENQKNLQKSLTAFKLLVKFAQESAGERKLELLRKDALRDMVLVYADLGDISEAQSYFKSIKEPELYQTLLERLAWLHADAGRFKESAEIYKRLMDEFPLHPRNPTFLIRLAGLYEKEQRRDLLVDAMKKTSEMIEDDSQWARAQTTQQRESARQAFVSEANLWSLRLHAEYQKSKNKRTAEESLQIYDLLLRSQSESAALFTALFNRSQLLTSLGEHDQAVDGYLKAALLDKKLSLKRQESKTGLENAIAESDLLMQIKGVSTNKGSGLHPLASRLIKILDLHVELFPKDPERLSHQYRAASLHFQAQLMNAAYSRWTALAKEAPQSSLASDGLRSLVKRSFDSGDWTKAAQDCKQFLAIPGINSAPVGAHLQKLLRVALFQHGIALEKSGRFPDAAALFVDFQRQFPLDPDAPKALVNAANNHFKANRADEALNTLDKFVNQYPQSEYRAKALELLAATAEGMGRHAQAAQALEQLFTLEKNREEAAVDLVHAARLRLAGGNPAKSVSNIQTALPLLKKANDSCEAYKVLTDAVTAQQSGSLLSTHASAAQHCLNNSPEWGIYFSGMAAKLSVTSGRMDEATRWASLSLTRGKNLKGKVQNPFAFEGLRLAGSVQLEMLEGQSRNLVAKRINNSNEIQVEFAQLRQQAQQLAQQYAQLAQAGQAETSVGALYRVAELQEGLANILVQAPNPHGMSVSDVETFRARIEKIALPLQEEATKLYAQALEKAHEAEVISPYTLLLQDKLSVSRPDDYKKVVEVMPSPSYMSHELPINKETKGIVQDE
jgi:tetratricopeptide (TPR) repeat protein